MDIDLVRWSESDWNKSTTNLKESKFVECGILEGTTPHGTLHPIPPTINTMGSPVNVGWHLELRVAILF